ncbi:ATP-binding cassette domain-containing protein [Nocardia sp. NPDC056064]|uniref:ABC transporter ATP-binding protein/permease n=1 Tax=Nocardia sp. NPDC056064 TaxID=3345701 RepID=UPI0035D5CF51
MMLVGVVVVAAAVGPWVAPYGAEDAVGMPFAGPGGGAVLGADRLGRDVLSHLLTGGTRLLVLSALIAALVTVLSAVLGAVAAVRPRAGRVIELAGDLVILLPAVLGILLVLTAWPDGGAFALVVVSLLFGVPYCARLFAAAAATIAKSGYVEAAVAAGESLPHLVFREILPNLRAVFTTQLGLRFVVAVYLVSTVAFLGFPALGADNWAIMVRDNAPGILLNPWSVLAPSTAIAIVAVGVNLAVTGGSPSRPELGTALSGRAIRTARAGRWWDRVLAKFGVVDGRGAVGGGPVMSSGRGPLRGGPGVVGGDGSASRDLGVVCGGSSASEELGGASGSSGCGQVGDSVVVEGLTVVSEGGVVLLGPLSFRLKAGSVTALTGVSGAGKSTAMRALLGHLPRETRCNGTVLVDGQEVFGLDDRALRAFRREKIAYVGQDPGSELNPRRRVRSVLSDTAPHATEAERHAVLHRVGLDTAFLRRRCGELSGGQQRRVALARAVLRRPGILILDEPFAGLHGALRTDIARLVTDLATHDATTILLSGHDTTTVHAIADTLVEVSAPNHVSPPAAQSSRPTPESSTAPPASAPRSDEDDQLHTATATAAASPHTATAAAPPHAATAAVPPHAATAAAPPCTATAAAPPQADTAAAPPHAATAAAPLDTATAAAPPHTATDAGSVEGGGGVVVLRAEGIGLVVGGRRILGQVGLRVEAGGAVAVVGVSGAGKTTLGRVIAGLQGGASGVLEVGGVEVRVSGRRIRVGTNGIHLVAQNPLAALNPRRTVRQTLARPLRRIARVPRREIDAHVDSLLDAVELPVELAHRRPGELSGGQRQRVALARALAARPSVLICDEITTALDATTATAIMTLLDRLRAEHHTAIVLISHDMSLVARHCTELVVLDNGHVVESGATAEVLASPAHPATAALLG